MVTTENVSWGSVECCCKKEEDCKRVVNVVSAARYQVTANIVYREKNDDFACVFEEYQNSFGVISVVFTFSDETELTLTLAIASLPSPPETTYYFSSAQLPNRVELGAVVLTIPDQSVCPDDRVWQFDGASIPLFSPSSSALAGECTVSPVVYKAEVSSEWRKYNN